MQVKARRKTITLVVSILALVISMFIVLHCSFNKPEAPQWDMEINIPLMNETYTMVDLADESEHLYIRGEDNLLGFKIEGELGKTTISTNMSFDGFSRNIGFAIGSFPLEDIGASQTRSVRFDQIWVDAVEGEAVVPEFDIVDINTSNIDYNYTFQMATIANGTADVTIVNNFPVDFTWVTLDLMAYLNGIEPDTLIDTIHFENGVPAGATVTGEFGFAQKRIPANMYWIINGHQSGSNGQNVQIDPAATIDVKIEIKSLEVSSAIATIPAIQLSHEQDVEFPEDVIIQEAEFYSGQMVVNLVNNTDLGLDFHITIPSITYVYDEQQYSEFIYMEPRTITQRVIELRDLNISPPLPDPGEKQVLKVFVEGSTIPSYGEFLQVTSDDSINAQVSFNNKIGLLSFTGAIEEQKVEVTNMTTEVDMPEGFSNFQFSRALLELHLFNAIGLPIKIDGEFFGTSSEGETAQVPIIMNIAPGSPSNEVRTDVIFDEGNSSIVQLINLIPEKVIFSGTATFGDGTTFASLDTGDYIRGDYIFTTPFEFSWGADTVRLDSTTFFITPEGYDEDWDLNEGDEIDGDVMDLLSAAQLKVTFTSRIPVGMKLVVKMSEDSTTLYQNPQVETEPLVVPQPPLTGTQEPVEYTSEVGLDEDEMEIFKNSGDVPKKVFVGAELQITGTDNEFIQVFASDYIIVNAMAHVLVHIEDEEDE